MINKIRLTVSNVYIVTFSIGELNLRSFQPRCVVHRSHNPVVIPITVGRRWAVLSPCDEFMPDILDNHIKFLDSILRVRKIYSTFTWVHTWEMPWKGFTLTFRNQSFFVHQKRACFHAKLDQRKNLAFTIVCLKEMDMWICIP